MFIFSSSNNVFTDITINNSAQDAILLEGATSDDNNFTGVVVTNTNSSCYDINFSTAGIDGTWIIGISNFANYSFAGAGGKVNFKEPSYGEIKFLEAINGNGTSLATDVDIENNSIFVNSSSNAGLNKSANITLYSITYTDPKPQYSSDGITFTDCTLISNPSCSEIDFSGTTFIFNVSHFTYFKSAEGYVAPSTPSGGGGGGGIPSYWTKTYVLTDEQFKQGYTQELLVKSQIKVTINGSSHYVGVIELTNTTAKINVSSTPQQATFLIGDVRKFEVTDDDYYDLAVTLNSIVNNKANITILPISEKVTIEKEKEEQEKEKTAATDEKETKKPEETKSRIWVWISVIAIVLILAGIGYKTKKKN